MQNIENYGFLDLNKLDQLNKRNEEYKKVVVEICSRLGVPTGVFKIDQIKAPDCWVNPRDRPAVFGHILHIAITPDSSFEPKSEFFQTEQLGYPWKIGRSGSTY